jgi:broad specificity phosphatase PhoE
MNQNEQKLYSDDTQGQILYIRHAESVYNTKGSKKAKNDPVRFDEQFMDSQLSEEGKRQSAVLAKKLEDIDFKYCFVSPLSRCLETCLISLEGKIKEKGIKVFVHPFINEFVSGIHDLSSSINAKKEATKGLIDWKYFDEFYSVDNSITKDQQFYYFNFVDNPNKTDEVQSLMTTMKEQENPENNKGKYKIFLESFWKSGSRPETFNHLLKRGILFKKFLLSFKNDLNLKGNEKILVFTHSLFIKLSTSNLALSQTNIEDFPQDCFFPKNCEMISIYLDHFESNFNE